MDHGMKYWFAQSFEKQCDDIHLEFYRLFHLCREVNEHNVKVHMNRCIKYTQFCIDDPKNANKVEELSKILELEKKLKDDPNNIKIAKKIDNFFCTDKRRKVFKPAKKENEPSLIDIMACVAEAINANLPQIRMSIIQYDPEDLPVNTYTGTFDEVFSSIASPGEYYYRIAVFDQNVPRERVRDEWFGIKTSCIGGLSFDIGEILNRYLNYMVKDYEKGGTWNFYYILNHFQWYDNAIRKCKTRTPEALQEQLDILKKAYPQLVEVYDLNDYRGKTGIYVLVLDKYNSCYIGQADDITHRIMRHWSRSDYYSGVGIDIYKAYDTTRIYVLECESKKRNKTEHDMVALVDPDVTINILSGGDIDYIFDNSKPLLKEKKSHSTGSLKQRIMHEQASVASLESSFIVER